MARSRLVIVGGGGTGDAAAIALRKRGFDGEIVIISADPDRPYDRPYLSKEFLRGEVELPKVFLHDEADYAAQKIDLRLGQRVTGGSLAERRLQLSEGAEVPFDVLVLGLGGTPRLLPDIPKAENVFTLRSLRDSQAIRQALASSNRMLVIGAGFIGAEAAASARQLGKEVLMVETAPVPLAR
ncbi:MAG: FAD-dependent oxidoreductase, partial [Candidatus Dormibacteraceae bacterium]